MGIVTILILIIYEHGISFPLQVSSLISPINVIDFNVQVFTCLVNFIPSYYLLFDAVVNNTIFLISHSYSLLIVYGNTTHLFM